MNNLTLSIVIFALIIFLAGIIYWINIYLNNLRYKRAARWVMFKVSIPKKIIKPDERIQYKEQDWKELLSVGEQLLASFSGIHTQGIIKYGLEHFKKMILGQDYVSCELVAKDGMVYFYIGCYRENKQYILKQIYSFYPHALVEESNDYKIFTPEGKYAYESYKLKKSFVYPIKTYRSLESDPLNAVTNVLGKLGKNDRACIQILLRPNDGGWRNKCSEAVKSIREGQGYFGSTSFLNQIGNFFHLITSSLSNSKQNEISAKQDVQWRMTPVQEEIMKHIREKGSKVGFDTQIRVIAISKTKQEAKAIVEGIYQAFAQYNLSEGNQLTTLTIVNEKKFISRFILREFSRAYSILNTEELASIFHFPNQFTDTPNIHWLKARILPPPSDLPNEGIIIGKSVYRGEEKLVRLKNDDRRRHVFMIGKTGVGKTTLFVNMIQQDIKAGKGCCFIDPLGDAIETILQLIPKERAEDVILFDPSDTQRPMGLNLLEWHRPEDKDFLVAEWLEIFYKLFDPNKTGIVGPQFEHWGRNASLTVMSQPGGGTLIEIPLLFTDDKFRDKCLKNVKDPVVEAFWKKQLAKTADFHKSEMFNYFISKFGRFMTNDLMRNIIGQRKSAFNIRKAMDEEKIILINLSKGKIGEMNSNLLGMILVSKIQVAAFSRADIPEEERKDFYMYIDEFQNFTTDTFKTILSEARKYHLSLNITNQYIAQLPEDIRDAVIGNAGTLIDYRIGAADAEFMEKEFAGVSQHDLTNLPFATMYVKLLIDGSPSKPFSMKSIKTQATMDKKLAESIRQLSRLKYGKEKEKVEEDFKTRIDIKAVSGAEENITPPRREA